MVVGHLPQRLGDGGQLPALPSAAAFEIVVENGLDPVERLHEIPQ